MPMRPAKTDVREEARKHAASKYRLESRKRTTYLWRRRPLDTRSADAEMPRSQRDSRSEDTSSVGPLPSCMWRHYTGFGRAFLIPAAVYGSPSSKKIGYSAPVSPQARDRPPGVNQHPKDCDSHDVQLARLWTVLREGTVTGEFPPYRSQESSQCGILTCMASSCVFVGASYSAPVITANKLHAPRSEERANAGPAGVRI